MERIAEVLRAGFPLVALLQLIRVYAQSIRKIAEAEVRLFHLYVHEPLIRQGVDALQMAEEMEGLVRDLLPDHLAADGVHPPALPALLHRAGRGRAHGGGARRAPAARASPDGVLLRRPDGLHSLHGGGGRRGGLRPGGAFRGDRRGHPARRGDDREDDRGRGDDRLARPGDAHGVGGWLPDAVPGAPPAASGRALRARGLPRRRLLRHRGQPGPPRGCPRPRRRGDGHHRGRRRDRPLGLPRVRPDRRGRPEGLPAAGRPVRRQARGVRREPPTRATPD